MGPTQVTTPRTGLDDFVAGLLKYGTLGFLPPQVLQQLLGPVPGTPDGGGGNIPTSGGGGSGGGIGGGGGGGVLPGGLGVNPGLSPAAPGSPSIDPAILAQLGPRPERN